MSREIMLENINKAQHAIDEKKEFVKIGKMRQHYHFMAQAGWINDPNGLIHWEYLPLALAPSEVYDDHMRGGCFSEVLWSMMENYF